MSCSKVWFFVLNENPTFDTAGSKMFWGVTEKPNE